MDALEEKTYKWLNKLILDVAIRGDSDGFDSIDGLVSVDVYWKAAGRYGIIIVVSFDEKWWYRIFEHQDEYQFNMQQVMWSLDNSEDSQYIYGSYEDFAEGKWELQKCSSMDWVEPVKAAAAEEYERP